MRRGWVVALFQGRIEDGTASLPPLWALLGETGGILVQDRKKKNVVKWANQNRVKVECGRPPKPTNGEEWYP